MLSEAFPSEPSLRNFNSCKFASRIIAATLWKQSMVLVLQHDISTGHSSYHRATVAMLGDVPQPGSVLLRQARPPQEKAPAWVTKTVKLKEWRGQSPLSEKWAKRKRLAQKPWGEIPTIRTVERLRAQSLKLGTWIQITPLWFSKGIFLEIQVSGFSSVRWKQY